MNRGTIPYKVSSKFACYWAKAFYIPVSHQRISHYAPIVNSSGKQCICTNKLQKPPISATTEMDGFMLVGRVFNPS